jgi:biotin carboxyl carrier protein
MTGTILEIKVTSGQTVAEGDELIIVESMKMEIPVESPQAGSVGEILVTVDDHIDEGRVLLRLETA